MYVACFTTTSNEGRAPLAQATLYVLSRLWLTMLWIDHAVVDHAVVDHAVD